jgi:hypothetical protein
MGTADIFGTRRPSHPADGRHMQRDAVLLVGAGKAGQDALVFQGGEKGQSDGGQAEPAGVENGLLL